MASVRQLIPRASLALHSRQLQHRLLLPTIRNATTTRPPPPPKPRVLEKPERFNPPSHPSRRARPRQYPGPPLSEHERQAQKTKKYPHMMPPEGSFMFWFLTNRAVHVWITLSVLLSLIFAIWFSDFYYTTPFQDLLPPKSMFYSHPFQYLGRYWSVYQMHVDHTSAEVAERRKQKVDDVKKRSDYRKAHGMEDGGLFGWTAKTDEEELGPALREGGGSGPNPAVDIASPTAVIDTKAEEHVYLDFEGKTQVARKKWFGIW
ncbi:hypothetical protein BDY17DRAFT_323171 [Neohortaea acidophila]|uniref:Uncharacterized protein n=1 Tax=Neohortaea acidophila TaxID=245834 RepID=A0A6A6PX52_9PEZI|nr:uncharacterized protein BDY17DRAFT_323171 [Neohortaea acidophila]KAF2484304.1 hypothetical protein BDY17DRAFT_323171 [Neohortaea acidophila]